MSSAKRVVDSTIRRILKYTTEILLAFILLVLISLPLVFTVPMWVQEVVFDVPSSNLIVNPIAWFGAFVTLGITIILGVLSIIFGYLFLYKIVPQAKSKKESEEEPEVEPEESDESETEDSNEPEEPIEEESIEEELSPLEESEDN